MEWSLPLGDKYKIMKTNGKHYNSFIVRKQTGERFIICNEEPFFIIKEYYLTKYAAQYDYIKENMKNSPLSKDPSCTKINTQK